MKECQIVINDVEQLENMLVEEEYPRESIQFTKDYIADLFDKAAITVFCDVLGKPLPDCIEIRLVRDKEPVENIWYQSIMMASMSVEKSCFDHFVFNITEFVFRSIIDKEDNGYFVRVALHEMMHAADLRLVKEGFGVLDEIRLNYQNYFLVNGSGRQNPFKVLYDTTHLLLHYRYEGIALLGEHLLSKRELFRKQYNLNDFLSHVSTICGEAEAWINGVLIDYDSFKNEHHYAYNIAMDVLLHIMLNGNILCKNEFEGLMEGFSMGKHDFTETEVIAIIRRALSMDIKAYLHGLLIMAPDGDTMAPKDSILKFVKAWKNKYKQETEGTLFPDGFNDNLYELENTFAELIAFSENMANFA